MKDCVGRSWLKKQISNQIKIYLPFFIWVNSPKKMSMQLEQKITHLVRCIGTDTEVFSIFTTPSPAVKIVVDCLADFISYRNILLVT